MKINPIYVTFEQAKLLAEKEYPQTPTKLSRTYYNYKGEFNGDVTEHLKALLRRDLEKSLQYITVAAPEQWEVVEWLRVNHGIWVEVTPDSYGEEWFVTCKPCSKKVWDDIELRSKVHLSKLHFLFYKTPQEAYSAAFDYILKELI